MGGHPKRDFRVKLPHTKVGGACLWRSDVRERQGIALHVLSSCKLGPKNQLKKERKGSGSGLERCMRKMHKRWVSRLYGGFMQTWVTSLHELKGKEPGRTGLAWLLPFFLGPNIELQK